MFTGIIEACVPVRAFQARGQGAELVLPLPVDPDSGAHWQVGLGQSIAICGVCLTVAGRSAAPGGGTEDLVFHLSHETLQCTWFGGLEPGRHVNVERALCLGDRLDGHLVSGHVDGRGSLCAIRDEGDGGKVYTFEVDPELERFLVDKGSITLDGISLTVVKPRAGRFDVALIPLTLQLTNLGQAEVGTPINVEADMIGKWIERLACDTGSADVPPS